MYYIAITNGSVITDGRGNAKLFTEANDPLDSTTTMHRVEIHSTRGDLHLVHFLDSNKLFAAVIA
jgi:hypothetical protein